MYQNKLQPKIIFLTGGVRSGKTQYAENLAGNISCKVAYLATAIATDSEMQRRINLHKEKRPNNWVTFEFDEKDFEKNLFLNSTIFYKLTDKIINIFKDCFNFSATVLIIDCITNLVFRMIYSFNENNLFENNEILDNLLVEKIELEINNFFDFFLYKLIKAKEDNSLTVIIISNEVGLSLVPAYPFGRLFRDILGEVNKKIAKTADEVLFFVSGLYIKLK